LILSKNAITNRVAFSLELVAVTARRLKPRRASEQKGNAKAPVARPGFF